jgi:hypothetical protein
MTLRGIIFGVAVWVPAAVFTSAGWSQSQSDVLQNRRAFESRANQKLSSDDWAQNAQNKRFGSSAASGGGSTDTFPDYYPEEINKSIEHFHSGAEQLAIKEILADLDKKSSREILSLKLAPDVCQEIACQGVLRDTVRRYVVEYSQMRIADDAHETALRNAAAAERSTLFAGVAVIVSLLSLLLSAFNYRRSKNAVAA